MRVAGFTSTGSKHPDLLFGPVHDGIAVRITASNGCHLTGEDGSEYLDFVMALGAVALGYAHPAVTEAVIEAARAGAIGSLAPALEEEVAGMIARALPSMEQVRFLKTGAEAVAAAVRLARTITRRDRILTCGYHGWLDWCSDSAGVPAATRALRAEIPFNDVERSLAAMREAGETLACVVVEPVVDRAPDPAWLASIRTACDATGALLIFDEIKTALRVGRRGAPQRWGVTPDLTIIGKAVANGYPLAAFGGRAEVMRHVSATWISSTMATEWVSLAAARATLAEFERQDVAGRLHLLGEALWAGLDALARRHPGRIAGVGGIPEMCHLQFRDEADGQEIALRCARRGLLFKRNAYNFVSLAHGAPEIERAITMLDELLAMPPAPRHASSPAG